MDIFRFNDTEEIFESCIYILCGVSALVYAVYSHIKEPDRSYLGRYIIIIQIGSIAPLIMDPIRNFIVRNIVSNTIQASAIASYLKIIYTRSLPLYDKTTLIVLRCICVMIIVLFETGILLFAWPELTLIGFGLIGMAGLMTLGYDAFNLFKFNEFIKTKNTNTKDGLMIVAVYGKKCVLTSMFANFLFFSSVPIYMLNLYAYSVVDSVLLSTMFYISILLGQMRKELDKKPAINRLEVRDAPVIPKATTRMDATTLY